MTKSSKHKSAVAYIRRSDSKQEESLAIQREIIERHAETHGYQIVGWYEDDGISGDEENRPGFISMVEAAEREEFEYILVRNLSRFCRFRMTTATRYLDILDLAGVHVVSTEEGEIDPEDLASVLIANINSHSNKKYLTDLSSNTIAGQAKKVRQGHVAGQRAPLGYDRMYVDENGQHRQRVKVGEKFAKPDEWRTILVPSDDPERISLAVEIFTLYADTALGLRGLAAELTRRGVPSPNGGHWCAGTIRAILTNRKYAGDYVWNRRREGKHHHFADGEATPRPKAERKRNNGRRCVYLNAEKNWVVHLDAHEAIIPRDLFDRVQEKLALGSTQTRKQAAQRRGVRSRAGSYLLSGLIRCGCCGGAMHGTRYTRKKGDRVYEYRSYLCSTYHRSAAVQCHHNKVAAAEIERAVVQAIADEFRDPELRASLRSEIEQELTGRRGESASVAKMREALAARDKEIETAGKRLLRVPERILDKMAAELADMERARDELAAEIEQAESQLACEEPDPDRVLARLDELADRLEQVDGDLLKQLLGECVKSIELTFKSATKKGRQCRICTGGLIHLNGCYIARVAGTGFEPATSRL